MFLLKCLLTVFTSVLNQLHSAFACSSGVKREYSTLNQKGYLSLGLNSHLDIFKGTGERTNFVRCYENFMVDVVTNIRLISLRTLDENSRTLHHRTVYSRTVTSAVKTNHVSAFV